jgi:hypothetical protein
MFRELQLTADIVISGIWVTIGIADNTVRLKYNRG